jgi:8-oxo-dGTP pyrophosphatase MutT (NUDIX family)
VSAGADRGDRRHGEALRRLASERLDAFPREPMSPGDRRHAAVAAVLLPDDQGRAAFLLTRRAAGLRRHAGQWALPGGRVDPGETAAGAALRELGEEVGLTLGEGAVMGYLDDYATRSNFVVTPVVVWADPGAELRANPAEVASIHLVPLAELDAPGVPRFLTVPERERPVVQLPILGTLIHAPTAAILYQLREVVLHGRATRVRDLEEPVWVSQ